MNGRVRVAASRLTWFGLVGLITLVTVAACGKDEEKPNPTATSAVTATAPAPATASPRPAGPVAASPSAAAPTVGELSDRISAAWAGVTSYRAVTITNASATPAAAGTTESIDEIIVPDRKHRINRSGDTVQYELIAVGGQAYVRGPQAPGYSTTRPNPDAWIVVDPAALASNLVQAEAAALYRQFVAPATAPYSGLSREERDRNAAPIGQVTVDGRACTAYQIADTTQTGERIEVILSLGADDLPCTIETRAGGLSTVTTFVFNVPVTIDAPVAASPAAGAV